MALTIEQIQENITNGGDVRQIINQLADYVQANPSSPGGDSGLLSATVELTDAQIKALPDSGFTLLAGEAGKAKFVSFIVIHKNTSAGAYVTSNNNLSIYYDNFESTSIESTSLDFDSTDNRVVFLIAGEGSHVQSEIEDIDVKIFGAGTTYTGGNAANTLSITTYYLEKTL